MGRVIWFVLLCSESDTCPSHALSSVEFVVYAGFLLVGVRYGSHCPLWSKKGPLYFGCPCHYCLLLLSARHETRERTSQLNFQESDAPEDYYHYSNKDALLSFRHNLYYNSKHKGMILKVNITKWLRLFFSEFSELGVSSFNFWWPRIRSWWAHLTFKLNCNIIGFRLEPDHFGICGSSSSEDKEEGGLPSFCPFFFLGALLS